MISYLCSLFNVSVFGNSQISGSALGHIWKVIIQFQTLLDIFLVLSYTKMRSETIVVLWFSICKAKKLSLIYCLFSKCTKGSYNGDMSDLFLPMTTPGYIVIFPSFDLVITEVCVWWRGAHSVMSNSL